jgi:hypothetical protein
MSHKKAHKVQNYWPVFPVLFVPFAPFCGDNWQRFYVAA